MRVFAAAVGYVNVLIRCWQCLQNALAIYRHGGFCDKLLGFFFGERAEIHQLLIAVAKHFVWVLLLQGLQVTQ